MHIKEKTTKAAMVINEEETVGDSMVDLAEVEVKVKVESIVSHVGRRAIWPPTSH